MAIFPLCWNHLHNFCSFLLHFLTPLPNGSMSCFNQFYKQFIVSLVDLALLTFGERSLSEEQKASSLFESGSIVTWEQAFHNLWLNSSANKLAPLSGMRLNIIPRKNDIVLDLVIDGEQWSNIKKVEHFSPGNSTLEGFILQILHWWYDPEIKWSEKTSRLRWEKWTPCKAQKCMVKG